MSDPGNSGFGTCDATGCDQLADIAYIGEGGDLYLCDFHAGIGEVGGWKRIYRCDYGYEDCAGGAACALNEHHLRPLTKPEGAAVTVATLEPDVCPDCHQPLRDIVWHQPALVHHGGYGATETHQRRVCRCGWTVEASVTATNPRST